MKKKLLPLLPPPIIIIIEWSPTKSDTTQSRKRKYVPKRKDRRI